MFLIDTFNANIAVGDLQLSVGKLPLSAPNFFNPRRCCAYVAHVT